MPFFPLAGAEVVVLILCIAIGRWILGAWWKGELEDETLLRWLPRRARPEPPPTPGPPALRLVRGGRREDPQAAEGAHRAGARRPRRS